MFAMQNIVFNVMKVPYFVHIICTLHSVPQVIDILVTKLNHNRGVLTEIILKDVTLWFLA